MYYVFGHINVLGGEKKNPKDNLWTSFTEYFIHISNFLPINTHFQGCIVQIFTKTCPSSCDAFRDKRFILIRRTAPLSTPLLIPPCTRL